MSQVAGYGGCMGVHGVWFHFVAITEPVAMTFELIVDLQAATY